MLCDSRYDLILKDLNVYARSYHVNTLRHFLKVGFSVPKDYTPPAYPALKWKPTI